MNPVFCDEPIRKVWHLEEREKNSEHWEYLLFFFRLAFYTTDGHWLVFETDRHFISLGADGVHLYDSKEQLERQDLELIDYNEDVAPCDFTDEALVFTGERVLRVAGTKEGWAVEFDHLKLALVPCPDGGFRWSTDFPYTPYRGTGHKLKKCECGGEAELMYDHVADYYIRCSECRRTTRADYRLSRVVKDWNEGKCPCGNGLTPFENFRLHWDKPIRRIAIPWNAAGSETGRFSCLDMILLYDDLYFRLESLCIPVDRCVFASAELSGFNRDVWPKEIRFDADETPVFKEFIHEGDLEKIVIASEKQVMTVTAAEHGLDVEIRRAAE